MRIIAGINKGRRLLTPVDKTIRPTSEKVKEALFSMVQFQLPEEVVCDLFAGTGNLGLEALSRGADHCYFGDHASESIKLIRDNIKMCKMEDQSTVVHGDYKRVLDRIEGQVDIFIIDPPYKKGLLEKAIETIAEMELLSSEGVIFAEHPSTVSLPETIGLLKKSKEKKYGTVVLSLYIW